MKTLLLLKGNLLLKVKFFKSFIILKLIWSSNAADAKFDQIIGCIEDVIMESNFQTMQDQFMEKNYRHFDDNDENKLIYTTVHKEYVCIIFLFLI